MEMLRLQVPWSFQTDLKLSIYILKQYLLHFLLFVGRVLPKLVNEGCIWQLHLEEPVTTQSIPGNMISVFFHDQFPAGTDTTMLWGNQPSKGPLSPSLCCSALPLLLGLMAVGKPLKRHHQLLEWSVERKCFSKKNGHIYFFSNFMNKMQPFGAVWSQTVIRYFFFF